MTFLAQMSWGQALLALLLIGLCLLLMLVILLQKGRGEGLSGAFGGGGGSGAFGAKTGDVFTWITVVVATLFVLLSVMANFTFDQSRTRRPPSVVSTTVPVPVESGQPIELPAVVPTEGAPGSLPLPAGDQPAAVPVEPVETDVPSDEGAGPVDTADSESEQVPPADDAGAEPAADEPAAAPAAEPETADKELEAEPSTP